MNRFTLVNLTSLIHLHLEVVRIVHLPRFFIFNLINLRKVAIIVNQTTFVNHTIFVNNLNLREITITYLSSYFDTINLLPLIHLSILKITGAQLQIGELTLINCYYLKRLLNLKVLTFEKIHCFDLRLHVNLEQLEFIECYISEPDFVNELRSLTYLEIRDCNLNLEYNRLILNFKLKNIIFSNNVISVLVNLTSLMHLHLEVVRIVLESTLRSSKQIQGLTRDKIKEFFKMVIYLIKTCINVIILCYLVQLLCLIVPIKLYGDR